MFPPIYVGQLIVLITLIKLDLHGVRNIVKNRLRGYLNNNEAIVYIVLEGCGW